MRHHPPGQDASGVVKTHVLDGVDENRLGFDNGCFGRVVHGFDQFVSLFLHAEGAHGLLDRLSGFRQGDAHALVTQEAIGLAKLSGPPFRRRVSAPLQAGGRVLI